jgi:hypothetical protein
MLKLILVSNLSPHAVEDSSDKSTGEWASKINTFTRKYSTFRKAFTMTTMLNLYICCCASTLVYVLLQMKND